MSHLVLNDETDCTCDAACPGVRYDRERDGWYCLRCEKRNGPAENDPLPLPALSERTLRTLLAEAERRALNCNPAFSYDFRNYVSCVLDITEAIDEWVRQDGE